ncbi:MAG: hypothetical protein AAFW84_16085 [Cyanobacteria bacterium J06635_15]
MMKLISLERHQTRTLLGVRFWDRLTHDIVADGLQVTVQRLSTDRTQRLGKSVAGQSTPSGTIAFFGLTDSETPAADTPELWDTLPPEQLVVIDMVDRRSRYLPVSFVARSPFRGVFKGQGEWLSIPLLQPNLDPDKALGIQLWSSPMRPVPPGRAMIRAQLVLGEGTTPAAHALVRVQSADSPPDATFDHYGLADAQGILALPVPYPAVPEPVTAGTPYPPLSQQEFTLAITVRYSLNPARLPGSPVPNLEALLAQPAAAIGTVWTTDDPPALQSQATLTLPLRFGEPLILRTALGPGPDAELESVLRIGQT